MFQRLIELNLNIPAAYRLLGFLKLAVGQPDEAIHLLQRSIRVDPLSPYNRTSFARIGVSLLLLGHDAECVEWHQRALAAGTTAPAAWRAQCYLFMASARALMGDLNDARHALTEANRLWPFATVRSMPPTMTPRGVPDPTYLAQMRRVQDRLRLAGLRDHADEDAAFGAAPDAALHINLVGLTPTTIVGATIIRTDELAALVSRERPILIDVALDSWGRSIPGAVGLQGVGHGASFSDSIQSRFSGKIHALTNGDLSAPIVAFCVNAERLLPIT